MKVRDVVAKKLGVPAANLIIYRTGGWLQDEISEPNSNSFNPEVPTEIMCYYAEISIRLGETAGQRFTIEFRKDDLV